MQCCCYAVKYHNGLPALTATASALASAAEAMTITTVTTKL